MASNLMQIDITWKEVPTTCAPCAVCEEIIYGKQYEMFTVIGGKEYPGEAILCESCYQAVEND